MVKFKFKLTNQHYENFNNNKKEHFTMRQLIVINEYKPNYRTNKLQNEVTMSKNAKS